MNRFLISPVKIFVFGAVITLVVNLVFYLQQLSADGKTSATASFRAPAFALQTKRAYAGNPNQIFVNGLGMKFVRLPNQGIAFGIHEVTREQFRFFAEASGLKEQQWQNRITSAGLSQENNHPVVNVSWEDATNFCNWLSEQEDLIFRLPTDYEWSLAAGLQAETGHLSPADRSKEAPREYFWGPQWEIQKTPENYADKSHRTLTGTKGNFEFDDGFPGTAPVGSFRPNQLGIYDMGGNVSEWVYDWYHGRDQYKTIRGASYGSGAIHKEIHYKGFRAMSTPGIKSEYYGFRVIAELPEEFNIIPKAPVEITTVTPPTTVITEEPVPVSIYDSTPAPGQGSLAQMPEPVAAVGSPVSNPTIPEVTIPQIAVQAPIDPVAAPKSKKVSVTYTKSDGINLRKEQNFSSSGVRAAIFKQWTIPLLQIGSDERVDTETWVKIEVKGWIPTKNSTHTYLKDQGNGTWKVTWSKPGDRYVAMRSGTSSDNALISKVNYGTVVEELDTKKIGSKHYLYGKFSGWVVKKNRTRSYIADMK